MQSLRVKPYNEALAGFRSICSAEAQRFVLAETSRSEILRRIGEDKPSMILAIGGDALNTVRGIADVPIVYLMVPVQQLPTADEGNITGVSITIAPERQLSLLRKALPSVNRIGVIYDPSKSGLFFRKARAFAKGDGLELVGREARSQKEIPSLLQSMRGSIDVFWMLPDTTVVTPETVQYFLLFSLDSRIPVVSFSEKYVEQGALLSFDIDHVDLGRQAGEMARRILAGSPAARIPAASPREVRLTVNSKVARKLGKTISHDILEKAKVY